MGMCLTKPAGQHVDAQTPEVKCASSELEAALGQSCCVDAAHSCGKAAPDVDDCSLGAVQQECVHTGDGSQRSSSARVHAGAGPLTAADEGVKAARANNFGSQACIRPSTAVSGDAHPTQLSVTSPSECSAADKADVVAAAEGDRPASLTRSRPNSAKSANSATGAQQPLQVAAVLDTRQQANGSPRCVKFAGHDNSTEQLPPLAGRPSTTPAGMAPSRSRNGLPRRSRSFAPQGSRHSDGGQPNEAVLAKQVDALHANRMCKLKQRRAGLNSSFQALQDALEQNEQLVGHVNTRAAGLKHIGFGPFKRENQDEFFIQVGDFGGQPSSNLFCVFDGHGSHGKDAALYSRQILPRLLDIELARYFERVSGDSKEGLKGAVEMLITEVFGETERSVCKLGVNLASSGTTASVAYQIGNRLWMASAGDSRAILCSRNVRHQWRVLPLTLDHRPRRTSERERIEAAGAHVAPKRLPSGRSVGEPRMWLHNAHGPGLLVSRSLGDLTAATVGCTSDPEVTFATLRPGLDHVLVMATDGVWDVLTNEQVCDIVVESPDPHIACRRVLDAALYEWEERMSADNITVLVVEFDWGEEGSLSSTSMEQIGMGPRFVRSLRSL